jgi:RNA polymerase sigma-B factor
MTEELGHPPTASELAVRLQVDEKEVARALALEETNRTLSLDGESSKPDSDGTSVLGGCLGVEDGRFSETECRVGVSQALSHLSEPLREVIQMRYLDRLSQREVGRRLSISQTQVSRMEKRALTQLRQQFTVPLIAPATSREKCRASSAPAAPPALNAPRKSQPVRHHLA